MDMIKAVVDFCFWLGSQEISLAGYEFSYFDILIVVVLFMIFYKFFVWLLNGGD